MSRDPAERLLVVVAVEREADAVLRGAADAGLADHVDVVAAGVGRVNAAIAVTRQVTGGPPPRAIISAGVAGSLPVLDAPSIGDCVIASASVYFEEGLEHEDGFSDVASMGFPLIAGADGNRLPADARLAAAAVGALPHARLGPVATVATCSGTDDHAALVRQRTKAVAEAMEGAAVLHTAAVLAIPAIELRTISNTTGDRARQRWDLDLGLSALRAAIAATVGPMMDAFDDRIA